MARREEENSSTLGSIVKWAGIIGLGAAAAGAVIYIGDKLAEEAERRSEEKERQRQSTSFHRAVTEDPSSKDKNVCTICYTSEDSPTQYLPCMHGFHINCLIELIEKESRVCPNCRLPLEDADIKAIMKLKDLI